MDQDRVECWLEEGTPHTVDQDGHPSEPRVLASRTLARLLVVAEEGVPGSCSVYQLPDGTEVYVRAEDE